MSEEWLPNFNGEDWSYSSETKDLGLTLEGLKIVEMILHFSKDKELGGKIAPKVKDALTKITE